MRKDIPEISTKQHTELDTAAVIENNQNEVSKVNDEYKNIKGTAAARITKSISFTEHEASIINAFLKENHINSIADFIKMALYRAGAFSDAFLLATAMQKKMDINFTKLEPAKWTFNYKNTFYNFEVPFSQEFAYSSSKRNPKPLFLTRPMNNQAQAYLRVKGFSAFVKKALVQYKVYSEALGDVVLASVHVANSQNREKQIKRRKNQRSLYRQHLMQEST